VAYLTGTSFDDIEAQAKALDPAYSIFDANSTAATDIQLSARQAVRPDARPAIKQTPAHCPGCTFANVPHTHRLTSTADGPPDGAPPGTSSPSSPASTISEASVATAAPLPVPGFARASAVLGVRPSFTATTTLAKFGCPATRSETLLPTLSLSAVISSITVELLARYLMCGIGMLPLRRVTAKSRCYCGTKAAAVWFRQRLATKLRLGRSLGG